MSYVCCLFVVCLFVCSLLCRYASLAHLNPDQIGNVLARATTNVLMIKNGAANAAAAGGSGGSGGTGGAGGHDSGESVDMDLPDDIDSPWRPTGSGGGGGGSLSEPRSRDKGQGSQHQDKGQGQQLKRSLWIPDDAAGPRVGLWLSPALSSSNTPTHTLSMQYIS